MREFAADQLMDKIYPRTRDLGTIYLQEITPKPGIKVGEYTMYNDFVNDPAEFGKNNVLHQYSTSHDRLVIEKFCSIACGAKFIFNSANHTLSSLLTYPLPLFFEGWGLEREDVARIRDNKGGIVVGNDVWIGYEAVIMAGVTTGDGVVIGARAVATKGVPPYTIVGGVLAKETRKRFPEETAAVLLEIKWRDWPRGRIAEKAGAVQMGSLEQLRQFWLILPLTIEGNTI